MNEEEIKKLMAGIAEKNGAAIKDAVETQMKAAFQGIVSKDQFEKFMADHEVSDKAVKELTESVEKIGLEIQQLRAGKKNEQKSIDEIVMEKSKEITELASGRGTVKFDVSKTTVLRSAVQSTTMAQRLAEVGELPYLGTVMSGLFTHATVGASSNGVIRYYDQNSVTRNAAFTAENATKPESAINWIERTLLLEKIADSIPVSKEAWKDIYFVQSELNRLLNVNLALNEDSQLWDGDGNTPNLKGVYTSAYAFDYVGDAVAEANIADLIAAVKVDIMDGRQSKYMPNVAVLNPRDLFKLKVAKASDGHYVLPTPFTTGLSSIDGIRIVESSQVTEDTMVVGDFRFGTIYDLEGISIEMGWVNDQFVKNAMTILAEKREGLLIRNVDQYAFCKVAGIDAAIASLVAGAT